MACFGSEAMGGGGSVILSNQNSVRSVICIPCKIIAEHSSINHDLYNSKK